MSRRWASLAVLVLVAVAALWMVLRPARERAVPAVSDDARTSRAEQVARGRYLALAGNSTRSLADSPMPAGGR